MANENDDQAVRSHIQHLVSVLSDIDQMVKEEGHLYSKHGLTDQDRARLAAVEVALDHCGDLLGQRRALQEFGEDPDKAKVRAAQ